MSRYYKLFLFCVCAVVSYVIGIVGLSCVPGFVMNICESRSIGVCVALLICSYMVVIAGIFGVLLSLADESRNL